MNPGVQRNQYLDIGGDNIEEDRRISLLSKVLQQGLLSSCKGRHEYKTVTVLKRLWRRRGKVENITACHVHNPYVKIGGRNGI